MAKRPIILVLLGHYLPGYRSGGPVQSIRGLVHHLGDEFDFRIITSDHDFGGTNPYPTIQSDYWSRVGKCLVFYIPSRSKNARVIMRLLRNTPHDILYLNSLFSRTYSILPLWAWNLGLIPHVPIIIAPRGELSPNALRRRTIRKLAYVGALRVAGICRRVSWQASSPREEIDITNVFRKEVAVIIAQDARVPSALSHSPNKAEMGSTFGEKKQPGRLSILYLGRIHPHKNLSYALSLLRHLSGHVRYDIFGPIEDLRYWSECNRIIESMPKNIVVRYRGEQSQSEIQNRLSEYDLLFLPSKSENYSHSIVEALSAGLPVLISDKTSWLRLQLFNAGWDIPLSEPETFISILQRLIDMDEQEFAKFRMGARHYADENCSLSTSVEQNRSMIMKILQGRRQ